VLKVNNQATVKSHKMDEDIYKMYLDGPYDWFNPIDIFTNLLTDGPTGDWARKPHSERIYEMSKQYPNLTVSDIEYIISNQKRLRGQG
jgi:hypothetical protein